MGVRVVPSRSIGELSGWDPSSFAKRRAPRGVRIVLSAHRHFADFTLRTWRRGNVLVFHTRVGSSILPVRTMLRWCNGQHLGPSNRRRRIVTVTEHHSMRRLRRGLWPLTPDSSVRHREPLPSRSFRRRHGSHKAVRRDRHARSGPCCLCSMAMSTPAVNRWDGVRIAGAVPIREFGVMTAQRLPTPLAWV